MKQLGAAGLQDGGLTEDSRALMISGSVEEFERIDWAGAAPSWVSIVAGVTLPVFTVVGLALLIDFSVCWIFEKWVGHLWTAPIWLRVTMVLPLALAAAIAFAKFFSQISIANWTVTKSKEVL
jgi:hypothetical protein